MFAPMNSTQPDLEGSSTSVAVAIRDASIEDAGAIEAVHYASREAVYGGKVEQWPPRGLDRAGRVERWRAWIADSTIECVVAERDGEIVGFVTLRPSPDEDQDSNRVAEMPTLYVRPDAWRSGVGRALCASGIERSVSLGFEELTLWVLEINTRARAFYEAFGFGPDGGRKVDAGTTEGLMADRYRIRVEECDST